MCRDGVLKARIDEDSYICVWVLDSECGDYGIELSEERSGLSLMGDVGAVYQ